MAGPAPNRDDDSDDSTVSIIVLDPSTNPFQQTDLLLSADLLAFPAVLILSLESKMDTVHGILSVLTSFSGPRKICSMKLLMEPTVSSIVSAIR